MGTDQGPLDGDDEEALRAELNRLSRPPQRCAICDAPRTVHEALEASGELHHKFSDKGELVQSAPQAERRRVVSSSDLVLRMALIQRGILTQEDLVLAEARLRDVAGSAGSSARRDREDRPPTSTG